MSMKKNTVGSISTEEMGYAHVGQSIASYHSSCMECTQCTLSYVLCDRSSGHCKVGSSVHPRPPPKYARGAVWFDQGGCRTGVPEGNTHFPFIACPTPHMPHPSHLSPLTFPTPPHRKPRNFPSMGMCSTRLPRCVCQ